MKKNTKTFFRKKTYIIWKNKNIKFKTNSRINKKKIFLNKNDNKNLNYIFFENNIDKQNSKI